MKKFLLLLRPENTESENAAYIQAISRFGGEVVLVRDHDDKELVFARLAQVEGILLPGGYCVGKLDFYLIEYAVKHQLKLLGICQGMQSMALWGSCDSLIEIGKFSHQQAEGYAHAVLLQQGRLRDILKQDKILVNSHHLQTVKRSTFFFVVGKSEDGYMEAVENSSAIFQIGVQWHPERMLNYDKLSQKLLNCFINDTY